MHYWTILLEVLLSTLEMLDNLISSKEMWNLNVNSLRIDTR